MIRANALNPGINLRVVDHESVGQFIQRLGDQRSVQS